MKVAEGSGNKMADILSLVPEKRNRTCDMKQVLACIADSESLFEIKPDFGRSVLTLLARMNSSTASQPVVMAGAMDTCCIDDVLWQNCIIATLEPALFCKGLQACNIKISA